MNRHSPADDEPLSIATLEQVHAVCCRFEDAWRLWIQEPSGSRPQIEDFLRDAHAPLREALLKELLLLDLDYRQRQGENLAPGDYGARFAGDIEVVHAALEHHDAVWAAASAASTSGVRQKLDALDTTADWAGGEGPAYYPTMPRPDRIGRYRVVRSLDHGNFGAVYLGHDDELNRPVAVKVPRADRFATEADVDRFLSEARTIAGLKHPGIVEVYDCGRLEQGGCFMVLEYLAGGSLQERLQSGRLSYREAAEMVRLLAEAVAHAHRRGFVHRDLKPANVLLDDAGNPRVTDFGLALHEDEQRRRTGERCGSAAYMSPEQVRGEADCLDGRADIWALGVMLYELLAGRRPFAGESTAEVFDQIRLREARPPRQIDASIPPELERICLKCLAKESPERYPTADDLAHDLRRWLAGPPAVRRRALVAAGAFGVLLFVAGAGFLGQRLLWPEPPRVERMDMVVRRDRNDDRIESVALADGGVWRNLPRLVLDTDDDFRLAVRFSRPTHWSLVHIDPAGEFAIVAHSRAAGAEMQFPQQKGRMASFKRDDPKGLNLLLLVIGNGSAQADQGTSLLEQQLALHRPDPRKLLASLPRLRAGLEQHETMYQLPEEYLNDIQSKLPDGFRVAHALPVWSVQ